jgi:hypothetical protein
MRDQNGIADFGPVHALAYLRHDPCAIASQDVRQRNLKLLGSPPTQATLDIAVVQSAGV